jgi:trigger factor
VTLIIHSEEDDKRQLTVTVEVSEDQVKKVMRAEARKLAGEIRVPGFRKGKAPYHVVVGRVGEEHLRAEAADKLLQPSFEEALQQLDVVPYAQAGLDSMQLEPLVYTYTVPLEPTVELAETYRELREDVEEVEITDEAVDEALEQIRTQHQIVEPVERPVAEGDLVTLSGKGVLVPVTVEDEGEDDDGETAVSPPKEEILFNEERTELLMDPETIFPDTAFVENIIGLSAGDEKTFTFTFADDYDEKSLAGREASFEITVLDVKSRILPELDDDLAKQEGDYETVADMREAIAKSLKIQAEAEAKNDLIEGLIDDLLEEAVVTYPPAAIEKEIDEMVASMKSQMERSGWLWDDYLKMQGFTDETIRDNFRENAQERLERQLVLRQFIVDEKLTVDAEDLDAKIEERLAGFGDNEELRDSMRQYFSSGYGLDMLSGEIIMDKIAERAKAIYTGQAPDLAELEAAALAADEEE